MNMTSYEAYLEQQKAYNFHPLPREIWDEWKRSHDAKVAQRKRLTEIREALK